MLDNDNDSTTTPSTPTPASPPPDSPDAGAAGPDEVTAGPDETSGDSAEAPPRKTPRRTTRKVGSRTTKKAAVAPQQPLHEAAEMGAELTAAQLSSRSPAEQPPLGQAPVDASGSGRDGEESPDQPPVKKTAAKRATAKKAVTKKTPAKKASTSRTATAKAGTAADSAGDGPVGGGAPATGDVPLLAQSDVAAAEPSAEKGLRVTPTGSQPDAERPGTDAEPAAEAATGVTTTPEAPKVAAPSVLFKAPDPVAAAPRRRRGSAAKTSAASGDASATAEVAAVGDAELVGDADLVDRTEDLHGGIVPSSLDVEPLEDRADAGSDDADEGVDEAGEGADEAGEGADEAADAQTDTDADDEQGGRRRRRRGGRRRRRSGGADSAEGGTDDSAEDGGDLDGAIAPAVLEPVGDADAPAEVGTGARASGRSGGRRGSGQRGGGQDRAVEEQEDADQEETGGTRRRRRRRRSGEDGDGSSDEPQNTVVRVRKPRNAEDEITSLHGSTRLEAKKQRRREGREAGRRRAPIVSEAEFLARREAVDRVMVIRQREDLTQIAVLEDKVLVEHYVARESQTSLIGNVYLGRVQNVLPSMEAAFIDIGKGRNAVLYAGEVNWDTLGAGNGPRKIEQVLKSGQPILVQVSKDPIGHKGARLTSQISLPGRFLVYVPDGTTSGISRKLPDTERSRLKGLLKEIVPDTAGVIVRTAAEGASEEELTLDVERLTARWADIESRVAKGNAPQLLYGEPDLTLKVVRDLFTEDFEKLVVSGDDAWEMVDGYVRHVAPDLEERLERYTGEDVFAEYRIDEQIAKGLDRKVWLPSGGSLVIDRTEAMTVVDVNTGKFTGSGGNLEETVTKNNLEAAEEMVRQLRLRDIGGIIVVDFIDMVLESNRDLVLRRLVECLGRDRTRHQVAEVTSLGLVQMTRKRIGTGLLEAFSESCEHCAGRGVTVHHEPVEPRKQEDEPRRGGRRGRDRGDSQAGGGAGVAVKAAPSPKDIAAIAKHEPRPVDDLASTAALAPGSVPSTGPAPAAAPAAAGPADAPTPEPTRDAGRPEVPEPTHDAGRPQIPELEPTQADGGPDQAAQADPGADTLQTAPAQPEPGPPESAAAGTAEQGADPVTDPVTDPGPPVTPPVPSGPRLVTSRRRAARRPAGPPSAGAPVAVAASLDAPVLSASNGRHTGAPADGSDGPGGPAGDQGLDGVDGLPGPDGMDGHPGLDGEPDVAGGPAEQTHVPVKKRGRKR